jgi:hypothetical protein
VDPTTAGDSRNLWAQGMPVGRPSVAVCGSRAETPAPLNWSFGTASLATGSDPAVDSRFDFKGTVAPTDLSRATDVREKGRVGIFGSGYSLSGSSPRMTSETIGRDINPLGRGDGMAYVGGSLVLGQIAPALPMRQSTIGTGTSVGNGPSLIPPVLPPHLDLGCWFRWRNDYFQCAPFHRPHGCTCPCVLCSVEEWWSNPKLCADQVCTCALTDISCINCQGDDTHWGHPCFPYHCLSCNKYLPCNYGVTDTSQHKALGPNIIFTPVSITGPGQITSSCSDLFYSSTYPNMGNIVSDFRTAIRSACEKLLSCSYLRQGVRQCLYQTCYGTTAQKLHIKCSAFHGNVATASMNSGHDPSTCMRLDKNPSITFNVLRLSEYKTKLGGEYSKQLVHLMAHELLHMCDFKFLEHRENKYSKCSNLPQSGRKHNVAEGYAESCTNACLNYAGTIAPYQLPISLFSENVNLCCNCY